MSKTPVNSPPPKNPPPPRRPPTKPPNKAEAATHQAPDPVPPPTPSRVLLPSEVARVFRVDRRTVDRWAEAGLLEAVRTPGGGQWRFPAAAVREFVPVGVELFRTAEVARFFRVDRRTAHGWAVAGRLPTIRTPGGGWRFIAAPVREHLAGRPASTKDQQETGEPRPIGAVVALDPNPSSDETRGVR